MDYKTYFNRSKEALKERGFFSFMLMLGYNVIDYIMSYSLLVLAACVISTYNHPVVNEILRYFPKQLLDFGYISLITSIVCLFALVIGEVAYHYHFLYSFNNKEDYDLNVKACVKTFLKIFMVAILKSFIISFGYALFFIPGIILTCSYSMTSFVIASNPELSVLKTMKKSKNLMKGFKLDYFALFVIKIIVSSLAGYLINIPGLFIMLFFALSLLVDTIISFVWMCIMTPFYQDIKMFYEQNPNIIEEINDEAEIDF